jgi:hypothetical protein
MRNRALVWGTGIPFAALAVCHVLLLAIRSADPRQYFDRGDPAIASWTYPTPTVVLFSLLLVLEAAIVWAILFSPGGPARGRRAMLGVLLTGPAALVGFLTFHIHSPSYVMVHVAWLFELAVIAIMTLALSAVGVLVSRLRMKSVGSG